MITLAKVQDMAQKLTAQGLVPKTIILSPTDAAQYPDAVTQLFGLNVVVANNYPESTVVPYTFEKVRIKSKTHKDF